MGSELSNLQSTNRSDSRDEAARRTWSVRVSVPPKHFVAWTCLLQVILVRSMNCSPGQGQTPPDAANAQKAGVQRGPTSEGNWPRTFRSGPDTFLIYEPQIETWEDNRINLYAAVEFKTEAGGASKYGVVWFSASTEVDKVNRLVTLDQAQVTKVRFPVAHEKESQLTELLNKTLPGATKIISLDRLEAALVAAGERVKTVAVKNDPPEVIIASKPSLLVLIDGTPQLREVPGTKLQRVINTRAILLFDNEKKTYYLRVKDWWLEAPKLEGPWTSARRLSDDMSKAEEYIATHTPDQGPEEQQAKQQPAPKQ